MGALFSCCCGEEEDSGSDAGERTRLIRWIWAGALVMTNDELLISSQIDKFQTTHFRITCHLKTKPINIMLSILLLILPLHTSFYILSVMVLVMVEPWCLTACIVKEGTVLGDSLRCLSRFGARSLDHLSGV